MGRMQAYQVNLSQSERDHLENLVSTGTEKARKLTRARILLKADAGWADQEIANALDVGRASVGRIRKRYATEGLDTALHRKKPRRQFEPGEARRILERLEFHFTPKHGSWLNMAEIELNVLSSQCLDRRIPDKNLLITEVAAWEAQRNQHASTVNWQFTTADARIKLRKLYPSFHA